MTCAKNDSLIRTIAARLEGSLLLNMHWRTVKALIKLRIAHIYLDLRCLDIH